jgi:hypothetical protein
MLGLGTVAWSASQEVRRMSNSKLGLHLLGDQYTPGARQVTAAGPRVLKIFDLGPGMRKALRDYKTQWPEGVVVLRCWIPNHSFGMEDDPAASADIYWEQSLRPCLENASEEERALIDYVEGPNEGDSSPSFESPEAAAWYADFWVRLIDRMLDYGVKPNIASIPVGNPGGEPEEIEENVLAFMPAWEKAYDAGGSWGYHGYTIEYTTDLDTEIYFSLRYRLIYDIVKKNRPELADLPLINTEGGVDLGGNAWEDGWVSRGSAEEFQEWLRWYDSELRKDDYVVGVTLFQSGGDWMWPSFELESVLPWMAEHLERHKNRVYPWRDRKAEDTE